MNWVKAIAVSSVKRLLKSGSMTVPGCQGPIDVVPGNNYHCCLEPRIVEAFDEGHFNLLKVARTHALARNETRLAPTRSNARRNTFHESS